MSHLLEQQPNLTTELQFCMFLIEQLKTQFLKCDKCGNEVEELIPVEQYKGGTERQLCKRCAL